MVHREMRDGVTVGSEKNEKAKRTNDKLAEFKQEVEEKFAVYGAETDMLASKYKDLIKYFESVVQRQSILSHRVDDLEHGQNIIIAIGVVIVALMGILIFVL